MRACLRRAEREAWHGGSEARSMRGAPMQGMRPLGFSLRYHSSFCWPALRSRACTPYCTGTKQLAERVEARTRKCSAQLQLLGLACSPSSSRHMLAFHPAIRS